TDYKLVPNLQQIVTDALVGMISGVTQMVPPTDEPLPDFIQAPIDRAVTRIRSEIDLHAAAAPAVQREPVGEVRFELGAPSSIFAELYSKSLPVLAPGTKLYAAPQPADQHSDISQLVAALEQAGLALHEMDDGHAALVDIDNALAAHRSR